MASSDDGLITAVLAVFIIIGIVAILVGIYQACKNYNEREYRNHPLPPSIRPTNRMQQLIRQQQSRRNSGRPIVGRPRHDVQVTTNQEQAPPIISATKGLTPTEFEEHLIHTIFLQEPTLQSCSLREISTTTINNNKNNEAPTRVLDQSKQSSKTFSLQNHRSTRYNEIVLVTENSCTIERIESRLDVISPSVSDITIVDNTDPESLLVTPADAVKLDKANKQNHQNNIINNHEPVQLDICSICLDEICDGDLLTLLPKCMHIFHTKCIREWLLDQKSSYCPLCKSIVKTNST